MIAFACHLVTSPGLAGARDDSTTDSLVLREDRAIGLNEKPPLGWVAAVAVDSKGNVYLLDASYMIIRKYSQEGEYIGDLGGQGEGPGMFYQATCMAIGPADRLYVAGISTIVTIIESDGTPVGQLKRDLATPALSIAVDANGNVYVVCLDIFEQKVIHKYDALTHKRVKSFCDSYAAGTDTDTRFESMFAGGYIDIDTGSDSLIFFAQRAPQRVKIFNLRGELLASHDARLNESHPGPGGEYIENGVKFNMPATSTCMLALGNGEFLTSLLFPGDRDDRRYIVDVYNGDGRRVATMSGSGLFFPLYCDAQGRIYVTETRNDIPVVVRYHRM